jgi:hypothetical protein
MNGRPTERQPFTDARSRCPFLADRFAVLLFCFLLVLPFELMGALANGPDADRPGLRDAVYRVKAELETVSRMRRRRHRRKPTRSTCTTRCMVR